MYINAMYLGMSNSGLPVFVFTLKKAFDTHAWSALGKLCFQPSGSGFSAK